MTTLLPTNNEAWGFWGTSSRNGYHAAMAWEAASTALVAAFDLTPIQVRDLLDSRLGRHLADDLSFIEGGPASPQAIEEHIRTRLADDRWRRWFERAVDDVRDAQRDYTASGAAPAPTVTARRGLGGRRRRIPRRR